MLRAAEFWRVWVPLWVKSRNIHHKKLQDGFLFWGFDDGKRHRELLLYRPCNVDAYVTALELTHIQDFICLSGINGVPADFFIAHTPTMMLKILSPVQAYSVPNSLILHEKIHKHVFYVSLCEGNKLVARGQLVCADGYALFDRIFVEHNYRRRGLATIVMQVLENQALNLGMTQGVLVATLMGEFLYQRLGWQRIASYQICKRTRISHA